MKDDQDALFTEEEIKEAFTKFPSSVEHSFVVDPEDKRFNKSTEDDFEPLFSEEEIAAAFNGPCESQEPKYNVGTRTGALICAGTPRPTTREQAEVNRKNANLPPLSKL